MKIYTNENKLLQKGNMKKYNQRKFIVIKYIVARMKHVKNIYIPTKIYSNKKKLEEGNMKKMYTNKNL